MKENKKLFLSIDKIANQIYFIRGEKVMFDFDLAILYGVETKRLKEAANRNIESFPKDFMFVVSTKDLKNLRSQIATSSWGGSRYRPMAFTEQGVAMLSSVLKSSRARKVNIAIMRTFVQMRKLFNTHKKLADHLKKLERRVDNQDFQISKLFGEIHKLLSPVNPSRRKIGVKPIQDSLQLKS